MKNDVSYAKEHLHDMLIHGHDMKTIKRIMRESYDVRGKALTDLIDEVKKDLVDDQNQLKDCALAIQLERVNEIYRMALEAGNQKIMLQCLEMINKLNDLYTVRVDANVDAEFTVEFG